MKAAVIKEQGAAENIVYDDWPDPVTGDDEASAPVKACALNYPDLEVRRGMPGFPIETPWISGDGAAGVVTAAGKDVTRARAGDRVLPPGRWNL